MRLPPWFTAATPTKRCAASLLADQLEAVGVAVTLEQVDDFEVFREKKLLLGDFDPGIGEVKLYNNGYEPVHGRRRQRRHRAERKRSPRPTTPSAAT